MHIQYSQEHSSQLEIIKLFVQQYQDIFKTLLLYGDHKRVCKQVDALKVVVCLTQIIAKTRAFRCHI